MKVFTAHSNDPEIVQGEPALPDFDITLVDIEPDPDADLLSDPFFCLDF
jgi:hypothetical protein